MDARDAGSPQFRWIVGLDPREGAEGSLRFSSWLLDALQGGSASVTGVHAYGDLPSLAQRYVRHADLAESAREQVAALLQRAGVAQTITDVELVSGDAVVPLLEAAADRHDVSAIVIGRSAPREGRILLRLGGTARRLLRRLPRPVVVVPPDFIPPQNEGSVIVATKLGSESASALRFGVDLARRTQRTVKAVYCLEEHHAAQYIPATTLERINVERLAKAREKLAESIQNSGLAVDAHEVLLGDAVESLVRLARDENAALLVSGSRRLSLPQRLLLTSAGSELAAFAPCPVAVVPPT